jgi:ATP-dependent Clp protease ATP-binding subunit ClpB
MRRTSHGPARQRLAERKIEIELTDAAKTHLVRTGYDPNYGARPLKRAIQREIETPLGRRILKGEVRDGQKVVIDFDRASGELIFLTEAVSAKEQVAVGSD